MQLRDLGALPPTLDTPTAAELLGVGVDHLWKLNRDGDAPVVPLRVGRSLRWPTVPLLRAIGIDPERAMALGEPKAIKVADVAANEEGTDGS